MQYHFGRLIDHVHLVVKDLEKSRAFYRAVLESLGRKFVHDLPECFSSDELFVSGGEAVSRVHLAFQVPSREAVGRFYEAALKAGGKDNGVPGERKYHPGYYAAFILDPDGNNLEAVFHGEASRSAPSVIVTP